MMAIGNIAAGSTLIQDPMVLHNLLSRVKPYHMEVGRRSLRLAISGKPIEDGECDVAWE